MKLRNIFEINEKAKPVLFELNKIEKFKERQKVTLSLDEEGGNLTRDKAYHLLRRLSFGPTPEEVSRIENRPISEVVDELLGDGLDYLPENEGRLPNGRQSLNWIDTPEDDPMKVDILIRGQIEGTHRSRYTQLLRWWTDLMKNDKTKDNDPVLSERLTFFWHTHWTIEFTYDTRAYIPPPILYRNNQKVRKYRLGNFKDFVEEMTLDGAYLLYQSLNLSTAEAPNENYARELMELFTMGIGNYTEGDIREASRALTGWRVTAHRGDPMPFNFFDTYFAPQHHDLESKQIMGEVISARPEEDNTFEKVRIEEVRELIEILFRRRPEAIANFICSKIYSHFVYSNPAESDQEVINELSQVFIGNDFELLPVFKTLFKSKHFYDKGNYGVQIKTPVELLIGLEKLINKDYPNITNSLVDTEQELYDPPNVGSWNGYRSWISTKTFPRRYQHINIIIEQKNNNDWYNFINEFTIPDDLVSLTTEILEYILPVEFTDSRRELFTNKALSMTGISESEWSNIYSNDTEKAGLFVKNFFKVISGVPDFQLA